MARRRSASGGAGRSTLHGALRELGLVTRDEWDDLELRVAQLEHRLRLVENAPRAVSVPPGLVRFPAVSGARHPTGYQGDTPEAAVP